MAKIKILMELTSEELEAIRDLISNTRHFIDDESGNVTRWVNGFKNSQEVNLQNLKSFIEELNKISGKEKK